MNEIPEELRPVVQSLTSKCSGSERKEVIKQYSAIAPWTEPIMPLVLSTLIANKKNEAVIEGVKDVAALLASQQSDFISTIEARNELISVEARAIDESLKKANDEMSRKLVALIDRVQASIETISGTQSQLLQIHQQLAIRTRQNRRGMIQNYAIGILIGFAVALFLQTL